MPFNTFKSLSHKVWHENCDKHEHYRHFMLQLCHSCIKRILLNTWMIMVWVWYFRTILAALFTMKARQLIQRALTYKTWHREVASMLLCDAEEGETQFVSASVSSTSQINTVKLVSVSHQGFFPGRFCTNVTSNNLLIYQILP